MSSLTKYGHTKSNFMLLALRMDPNSINPVVSLKQHLFGMTSGLPLKCKSEAKAKDAITGRDQALLAPESSDTLKVIALNKLLAE